MGAAKIESKLTALSKMVRKPTLYLLSTLYLYILQFRSLTIVVADPSVVIAQQTVLPVRVRVWDAVGYCAVSTLVVSFAPLSWLVGWLVGGAGLTQQVDR